MASPTQSAWCSPPIIYVFTSQHHTKTGSLVEHRANGGIAREDCCIIEMTTCYVNVEGVNNHVMEKQPIVMAGATIRSDCGHVILIMHQYAHADKGHSVHSSPQHLEPLRCSN